MNEKHNFNNELECMCASCQDFDARFQQWLRELEEDWNEIQAERDTDSNLEKAV